MKLPNIEKLINKLKTYNPAWDYSPTQVELMESIKEVNPYILASKLAKKYLKRKSEPGVDLIEEIANSLPLLDEDKEDVCGKCRHGMISVFNSKQWFYDEDSGYCRDYYGDWTPDKIKFIFMMPKMIINCDCVNRKRDKTMRIHSYLKWLSDMSYKSPELFELCYIQLFIFVTHSLEIPIKFNDFDPYRFWGASNIDSPALLSFVNIKSPHIKELFIKAFVTIEKPEIPKVKLKKFILEREDIIL